MHLKKTRRAQNEEPARQDKIELGTMGLNRLSSSFKSSLPSSSGGIPFSAANLMRTFAAALLLQTVGPIVKDLI